MSDYPSSLRDFAASFPDDEACARWLSAKRWPDGFTCPACGHGKDFELERGVLTYQCARCRKQTSVTAGTVLHSSHLPLKVWFLAAWWRWMRPACPFARRTRQSARNPVDRMKAR